MRQPRLVIVYVVATCCFAAVLLAQAEFGVPPDTNLFWNTVAALVVMGLLAEFFSLQLRAGGSTSALSFVPYLAAIQLVGPSWAMLLAGLTELFAETVIRRKPLVKIVHNTSKEMVAVYAAGAFYIIAGGSPVLLQSVTSPGTFNLHIPGFLGATLIYFLVSNGSTATAVGLSTGTAMPESWSKIVGRGLAHDVLSSSLAPLLAHLWIQIQFLGLLLVAVPLFFVRHAFSVNLKLEQANRELLELMVKSIEARDPYTSGHSLRVATYAKAIARALGLPSREIEQIETSALLHDVGKIYEEFAPILRKEAKLTAAERDIIKTHSIRSAELASTISSLRGYVEQCVRAHHENFDGSGYPDGLAGDEIPVGARIIMVADTADAMMTDRPYRDALTYDEVVSEFERCSGSQFDPAVIEAFKRSTAVRHLIAERRRVQAMSHASESEERLLSLSMS
jgi:putative nucleotidyltransferase with HDIG domain